MLACPTQKHRLASVPRLARFQEVRQTQLRMRYIEKTEHSPSPKCGGGNRYRTSAISAVTSSTGGSWTGSLLCSSSNPGTGRRLISGASSSPRGRISLLHVVVMVKFRGNWEGIQIARRRVRGSSPGDSLSGPETGCWYMRRQVSPVLPDLPDAMQVPCADHQVDIGL